jgi:DNA polymerase-3 subunit delta'
MGYLESAELIGHDALRGFLARSRAFGRHHAYLLAGAEHLGKDTVARALVADELNRPVKAWADLAGHPDVKVLSREEGEKNIGVTQVRAFINHFSSSSFWGGRKIGVICGAHELSLEAANALLKTLEEPAGNALLILTAHTLERLPETIKSRCQLVRFLTVAPMVIGAGLIRRGVEAKAAAVAAAFSAGRPGLAVLHVDDDELRTEHAGRVRSFMDLVARPVAGRLAAATELTAKAETATLAALLDVWVSVLRDVLSIKTGNERYASDPAALPGLRPYALSRPVRQIVAGHRALSAGKKMLGENVNPRLIFEHIALSL